MAAVNRVEKGCVRTGSVVRELDGVSWIANSYGTCRRTSQAPVVLSTPPRPWARIWYQQTHRRRQEA